MHNIDKISTTYSIYLLQPDNLSTLSGTRTERPKGISAPFSKSSTHSLLMSQASYGEIDFGSDITSNPSHCLSEQLNSIVTVLTHTSGT